MWTAILASLVEIQTYLKLIRRKKVEVDTGHQLLASVFTRTQVHTNITPILLVKYALGCFVCFLNWSLL